jgi:dTDP-4-dehydrorhamnose 3,5-epimerase
MVETHALALVGLLEARPERFSDERGFFSEVWSAERFRAEGIDVHFVQDNESLSRAAGVVRGLHFQRPPCAQDKLIRVVRGSVFDVAVDIRRGSPSFGRWVGLVLSAEEGNQLFIPKGFAHGFMTLEADSHVLYKVSAPYSPSDERCIRFDDPAIGIDWPSVGDVTLSAKDAAAPPLAEIDTGFELP